jgi:hypothetical protein
VFENHNPSNVWPKGIHTVDNTSLSNNMTNDSELD